MPRPSSSSPSVFDKKRERPFEEFFVARKAGRSLNISCCFPGPAHTLNQKFPNVVLFCFPDRAKLTGTNAPPPTALRFTFVLTNEFGERLFGHSLQLLHGDLICFISRFCWVRFFDEVLYRYRMNGNSIDEVISFYHAQVPRSLGTFHSPDFSNESVIHHEGHHNNNNNTPQQEHSSPSTSSVESIAEGLRRPNDSGNAFADVRLANALEFLSNDVLLQVMSALMCEARVVIVGQRIAHISDAVLAVVALLQPFDWQHVLIPVLPNDLLDVLCSPTPFLIGLLAGQIPSASKLPAEDTVVVVLGKEGGRESYVRKGIPTFIPTLMDTFPDAGTAVPAAQQERTQQEIEDRLEAEELYGPILHLPFTDSSLCSLRVGLFQARRHNSNNLEMEADRALLAAFHDYYVFAFGLVFANDFTPQNFTARMVAKTGEGEQQTGPFFERVSDGMMLNELRTRKQHSLVDADAAALEMKKHRPSAFVSSASNNRQHNNDDDESPGGVRAFIPSPSDVFHIRNLLGSEFLEAVLERYPLLFPHAAQVLAYSNNDEDLMNSISSSASPGATPSRQGRNDGTNKNNNNNTKVRDEGGRSRTVAPLEAADILRKCASWCSYGFTSTVQKLTTTGKTVNQTRAELEEL